jgi:hypothetical protein
MDNVHLVRGGCGGMAILHGILGRAVAGECPVATRTLKTVWARAPLRLTSTELKETEPC